MFNNVNVKYTLKNSCIYILLQYCNNVTMLQCIVAIAIAIEKFNQKSIVNCLNKRSIFAI